MSTPISIFFNSNKDIVKTISEVESALNLKLNLVSDNDESEEVKYQYHGLGFVMTLFNFHGLEDDQGLPFSNYQYEIDFDIVRDGVQAEVWENLQYYTAMYSYNRIIAQLKYPIMVVDNLQKMIANYP
ncbi:MAG: hypothetical protein HC877_01695 [Thioploca sp.]|nr:hypothetical protein [Thioploca sp.]